MDTQLLSRRLNPIFCYACCVKSLGLEVTLPGILWDFGGVRKKPTTRGPKKSWDSHFQLQPTTHPKKNKISSPTSSSGRSNALKAAPSNRSRTYNSEIASDETYLFTSWLLNLKWIHHAIFCHPKQTMISVQCPIPFGGAHHFFPCEGSNQRSTCGENHPNLWSAASGESVSIFIGFKTDSNAASGVSLCFSVALQHLDGIFSYVPLVSHQQFHQPKKSGHVSNIQSSSFASSWMSWPWPRLQLLEFQSLVLRQKFLVPVLTWHGLSRVLHDPPDVW